MQTKYDELARPGANAETLARRFHEAYERLAPSFGYETRQDTRAFDPDSQNGRLMMAVCAEVGATEQADRDALAEALRPFVKFTSSEQFINLRVPTAAVKAARAALERLK